MENILEELRKEYADLQLKSAEIQNEIKIKKEKVRDDLYFESIKIQSLQRDQDKTEYKINETKKVIKRQWSWHETETARIQKEVDKYEKEADIAEFRSNQAQKELRNYQKARQKEAQLKKLEEE